ncbi:SRPBCC family protein [Alienimonas californiensis]|uniref:Polyketide cyclase / dehydrase and lipid transport n=1 Tax=Alienimonas californiensis TaxID=2527989 RepID=A0A517P854_9PLAN|nr:SRPBCC family protein [Alienimonas californiensis]QDT15561.1 Polyketide cyclase / dehydrase and lipid transport [Alienimonas californiensis]
MPAVHELHFTVALAAAPAEIFACLIRPEEVMTLTDPNAGVRLRSGPKVMAAGTANELEITGFGVPQRVVYTVTAFEDRGPAGGAFTETMTKGPLPVFENDHVVAPAAEEGDGCTVHETYRFAPPGGLLGFVLTADRLRGELEKGLAYRRRALIERFGAA